MDGSHSAGEPAPQLRGGVHTLTVTDAAPGTPLRVVDAEGRDLVTVVADASGNAHLAFVPQQHTVLDRPAAIIDALATGDTLAAGEYLVIDDGTSPPRPLGSGAGAVDRGPPGPGPVRPGARRGLRLPDRARRRAALGDGPLPRPLALRTGALPDGDRVLGLLALGPRRAPALDPAGEPHGLRGGRRQHARQRLLGRRVRRVQPRPGSGRLRRRGDRRPSTLGPARSARHGRAELPRHQPALRRGHPPSAPGRDRSDVGDRRPVAPAVAGRRLQLRVHTRLAGDARPADRRRWPVLGPPADRVGRHRGRAEPAGAVAELRLRAVRPEHRELPPDARGPTRLGAHRPHRGARLPHRGMAGRADRQPVRARCSAGSAPARTCGSTSSTATTPTATAPWS